LTKINMIGLSLASNINIFPANEWGQNAVEMIVGSIQRVVARKGRCSVMLTGGRAGARLYEAWGGHQDFFSLLSAVDFYFGDERCVPSDHHESNYRLVMDCLFRNGIPEGCSIQRIEAEHEAVDEVAASYAELLPEQLDILLLGVGEDGHVASLFPNHSALAERKRRVVPVVGPKPPFRRLTVTVPVIQQACEIYVLAPGRAKAAVLERAIHHPDDIEALPARLVIDAVWLLDRDIS